MHLHKNKNIKNKNDSQANEAERKLKRFPFGTGKLNLEQDGFLLYYSH
jgi:hypothetical protein